jgi:F-box and WD-40 domain protein CDC4
MMEGDHRIPSLKERRASTVQISYADGELSPTRSALTLVTSNGRPNQRTDRVSQAQLRGPPTPNMSTPSAEPDDAQSGHGEILMRPPTPAESPRPDRVQPDWSTAGDEEDVQLANMRAHFINLKPAERTRLLGEMLNVCTSQELSFVAQFVSPLLKKDPFTSLPDELCLRVRLPSLSAPCAVTCMAPNH